MTRRITVRPVDQAVQRGEVATFKCSVFGTGVSISWQFMDMTYNSSTSQPEVFVDESTTANTVESTLNIETVNLTGQNYNVDCMVYQMLSSDQQYGATLEIINGWWIIFCGKYNGDVAPPKIEIRLINVNVCMFVPPLIKTVDACYVHACATSNESLI